MTDAGGNTTDAGGASVIASVTEVDAATVTDATTIPLAATTPTQQGVEAAAVPVPVVATLSNDISFSDGSEMSLADGSLSGEQDVVALSESPNEPINNGGDGGGVVVVGGGGESIAPVVESVIADSAVSAAATSVSTEKRVGFVEAVKEEEKNAEKNEEKEKKPAPSRRDTMMAVAGEEGESDEGIVLSELEDRFLTSVAYNKQSVIEGTGYTLLYATNNTSYFSIHSITIPCQPLSQHTLLTFPINAPY